MISATVVLDSVSPFSGHRLTTMVVVMPRIILAEFNTHRVFSRNSASSRAIPVKKLIERVLTDPFVPRFTKAQRGMASNEYFDEGTQRSCEGVWLQTRDRAAADVEHLLNTFGVHKQHANRLLEPFLWHTVLVSSTDWENFFAQRCNPGAQPEMQETAEAMRTALYSSIPKERTWHWPFADDLKEDWSRGSMISAGRCAVVSYDNLGEGLDPEKDYARGVKLYDATPPHYSPAEHVACASVNANDWANFKGWGQLRKDWELRLHRP